MCFVISHYNVFEPLLTSITTFFLKATVHPPTYFSHSMDKIQKRKDSLHFFTFLM